MIGITGTNGKSTVTSWSRAWPRRPGARVLAGGNLGDPALDLLEQPIPDLYVLELSSFQLETTSSLALEAAVVLNVTADHMDRYPSVGGLRRAKSRIFANAATMVLNVDDPLVSAMRRMARASAAEAPPPRDRDLFDRARRCRFLAAARRRRTLLARHGERLLDIARMKIAGLHNAANALAALALGDAVGLPMPAMLEALESFPGLPHRSAWIADVARRALRR